MKPAKNIPSTSHRPQPSWFRKLFLRVFWRGSPLPAAGWLLALAGLAACAPGEILNPPTPTPEAPPRIAFMSDREGNFDIFVMDLDGSNLVNLTNNPAQDGLPAWSGSAGALAFLSDRVLGQLAFYQLDGLGGEPVVMNTNPPPTAGQAFWSPNGQYVAFQGGDTGVSDIYILDLAADTTLNLSDSASLDTFGAWSADSRQVLFTSTRAGSLAIFTSGVGGGEPTRLTDPSFASTFPAWAPDGSKIAFTTDQDGDVEVYLMDADGGNITRLTEAEGFDGYPAWSPDGARIAFLSNRDGNPEIYVMNADGSGQTNLTNNPAAESTQGDFSWSPDGARILFQTDRDGDVEVYVMDADGGNPTNLSAHPATDLASIWVP